MLLITPSFAAIYLGLLQNYLAAKESFCEACGRGTFDSADAVHCLEGAPGEPMLRCLSLKVVQEELNLSFASFLGKRHEHLRTTQVAIIFEDFILEDQVISECVPGEVRQDPVILMSVIAIMREDQLRIKFRPNLLKQVFD